MSLVLLNRLFLYSFREVDLASRYGGGIEANNALPRYNPNHPPAGDSSNVG
jgi:hypothetical protein